MALTRARREALAVLVAKRAFADSGNTCRRSNATDLGAGHVYWQSADWLIANGYAREVKPNELLELTPQGLALASREGLGP